MKNIAAIFFSAAILGLTLTACAPSTGTREPVQTGSQETTNKAAAYEEVTDLEMLPSDVKEAIDGLKAKRGFLEFKVDDRYFVWIGSGEKMTGGYAIKVVDVTKREGVTVITVEETQPKKGDMVTEALTYPYVIVKLESSTGKFEVVTREGTGLPKLSAEQAKKELIQTEGQFVGRIDNNSFEVKVGGETLALRDEGELQDIIGKLQEGTSVNITYYQNEHGQLIVTQLLKLETAGEKNDGQALIQAEGEYAGQIDGTSVEIKVKGEAGAYRHEGKLQDTVEKLKSGDAVTIRYHRNEHGQMILTSIEKGK